MRMWGLRTIMSFLELPISDYIQQAIQEMGFEKATPIQSGAIPVGLQGKDLIGQAQTGTGKTAAFGIPAIEHVDVDLKSTQVLIMCPTRELALQVKEQIYLLSKYKKGLWVSAIYGGESYEKQFRDLKRGAHIVVGTPGRIMDHLERSTLKLQDLKLAILDEADEMLNMGFREDMEEILSYAPKQRQTMLFSATMSKEILDISKKFLVEPEIIKVTKKEVTNDNIEQWWFNVRREAKTELLCRLIEVNNLQLILVFCNTKAKVDEVVAELIQRGYEAEGLHGDMRQAARNQVMSKFKNGRANILVATDVAARGIDVNDVDAVINYDVPLDIENYVHRIGRTGRAGKSGKAFSFVPKRDMSKLREMERYTKVSVKEGQIPTIKDLEASQRDRLKKQIISNIQEEGNEPYEMIIDELKADGYPTHRIITALLRMREESFQSGFSEGDLAESKREKGSRKGNDRREKSSEPRSERRTKGYKGTREAGMVRLFLNVGRKDRVSANHIVGAISAEAKIPGKVIGSIDIYDAYSFVEVPERDVNKVLTGMRGKTINTRDVNFELSK